MPIDRSPLRAALIDVVWEQIDQTPKVATANAELWQTIRALELSREGRDKSWAAIVHYINEAVEAAFFLGWHWRGDPNPMIFGETNGETDRDEA